MRGNLIGTEYLNIGASLRSFLRMSSESETIMQTLVGTSVCLARLGLGMVFEEF